MPQSSPQRVTRPSAVRRDPLNDRTARGQSGQRERKRKGRECGEATTYLTRKTTSEEGKRKVAHGACGLQLAATSARTPSRGHGQPEEASSSDKES
ncbi:hypothetical protein CMQ_6420 [Grosmannia clavigera kw1407]|uniref:Uncharacterized protein n=1 Tax=Grosmannia clavigera (strain kw1407 / UAMH 11150) TaxID=655863 RepID=F0XLF7_GROCL|nr:uncharacterized protein CMQ_6420 [Grosmannia clavigera kw1407]EFX01478.1 hypothetical protein CMQ_6420 [Grosmannia clavigera kw1407]